MHHLPAATAHRAGFGITLEVHTDAIAPDLGGELTMATLTDAPQKFTRAGGPEGRALGHLDMLRHLARHAFVPVHRIRLIHLYDLWRYQARFRDQVDWQTLRARFPGVVVALNLVNACFAGDAAHTPASAGRGMLPLADIAALRGLPAKLDALFNPPAWWLRGFYGIAPEKSLLGCRCLRHPATIAHWLAKRVAVGLVGAPPIVGIDGLGRNERVVGSGP